MPRNFDSEWADRKSVEARTFVMGGETFVLKAAVRPEVFDEIQDVREGGSIAETYKIIDDQFLMFVEDENGEAEKRYRALREKPDGLGVRDLREVLDWMVEEHTGRPPTSQPASPPTPKRTGTRSTGGSSSRALTAVSEG
jgi:hypothetical protein